MLTQTHRAVMDGSINRVYRACGAAGGQLAVGADPGLNTLFHTLALFPWSAIPWRSEGF